MKKLFYYYYHYYGDLQICCWTIAYIMKFSHQCLTSIKVCWRPCCQYAEHHRHNENISIMGHAAFLGAFSISLFKDQANEHASIVPSIPDNLRRTARSKPMHNCKAYVDWR